jgi:hypothetical protein
MQRGFASRYHSATTGRPRYHRGGRSSDASPAREPEDYRDKVLTLLQDEPWVYGRTEIKKKLGGRSQDAGNVLTTMAMAMAIIPHKVRYKDKDGRLQTKTVYALPGTPPPSDG